MKISKYLMVVLVVVDMVVGCFAIGLLGQMTGSLLKMLAAILLSVIFLAACWVFYNALQIIKEDKLD